MTVLYLAVKKANIEIIKLLLQNDKLDINAISIFNEKIIFLMKFYFILFNIVS